MLKKILTILLCCVLCGCSAKKENQSKIQTPVETGSEISVITDSYTENVSSESSSSIISENSTTDTTEENNTLDEPVKENVNQNTEAQKPVINNDAENEIKPSPNTSNGVSNKTETIKKPDEREVANFLAILLNEERNKLGVENRTSLQGLNNIAIYRSKQIIEQFSHNWIDESGKSWQAADYAALIFKYGKHSIINETRFDAETGTVVETGKIIETFSYGGTENIAKGGIYSNQAEEIARYIISVFKGSSNHWNSLMNKDKLYDGIGVTIQGDYWYCSINSSEINYG